MISDRQKALEAIYAQVRKCRLCQLYAGRTQTVPGDGPVDASIMFIGEAPGFHEDQRGIPFVGAAGRFLDELLSKASIDRNTVYITNVIKCRPPGNREPQDDEVAACKAYLDQQIAIINPRIVVTLGHYSMVRAFPEEKISIVHGQARKVGEQIYLPMYHPAAALHQPSLRSVLEMDFQRLHDLLEGKLQPEVYNPPPQVEQLSLF